MPTNARYAVLSRSTPTFMLYSKAIKAPSGLQRSQLTSTMAETIQGFNIIFLSSIPARNWSTARRFCFFKRNSTSPLSKGKSLSVVINTEASS
uniref:Pentatricopeptide repeat-containing protein n=1 Tax=Rhizophora mucronata TaxID=61149 RepID=A0A2P2IWB8_RHIMU